MTLTVNVTVAVGHTWGSGFQLTDRIKIGFMDMVRVRDMVRIGFRVRDLGFSGMVRDRVQDMVLYPLSAYHRPTSKTSASLFTSTDTRPM